MFFWSHTIVLELQTVKFCLRLNADHLSMGPVFLYIVVSLCIHVCLIKYILICFLPSIALTLPFLLSTTLYLEHVIVSKKYLWVFFLE